MSKQSKPANPSDLLTHPAVVHAIKQAARRLSRLSVFRRVQREAEARLRRSRRQLLRADQDREKLWRSMGLDPCLELTE